MITIVCRDYGVECHFKAEGKDLHEVAEIFGQHTLKKHGRDYSKEALTQFIINMQR